MYRIDSRLTPPEALLTHLSGYRDSRPVRLGNDAATETQLDIYGELIDAIAIYSQRMPNMRPLRPSLWRIITSLANEAVARWAEPDQGLWEMRGPPRHFLASKLMCWVAVDRALFLAARDRLPAPTASWHQAWTEIRRAILQTGYNRDLRAFTQGFDIHVLDASTLLLLWSAKTSSRLWTPSFPPARIGGDAHLFCRRMPWR
jgi:GH15 family glucan-1,4-alpha-glucosidase